MRAPHRTAARYTVKEARGATREEWDAALRGSPGGGHALQSFEWAEFKRGQGWRPLRLVLEKDGEVAGAGQFLLRSTLPVPGSLMYCTKGPWLEWEDEDAVRTFFGAAAAAAEREGAHTVKIEPEVFAGREDVKELLEEIGFQKARYDLNFNTTILVDLDGSEEELLTRMTGKKGKTTRYNIRQSLKEGVEVVEPEDFEWAFETFYGWMLGLAGRKEGFHITRPPEYFREVMRRMNEADQGRFFFAMHEGEPLAGGYAFNFGGKLWHMYGATPDKGHRLQPTYALQWGMMRWARQHGITYYDMVGIPKREEREEGHPYYGVYRFKKGFGGEEVDFLGCLDLPVEPLRAAAWYRLEPLYYRLYQRLMKNVFY